MLWLGACKRAKARTHAPVLRPYLWPQNRTDRLVCNRQIERILAARFANCLPADKRTSAASGQLGDSALLVLSFGSHLRVPAADQLRLAACNWVQMRASSRGVTLVLTRQTGVFGPFASERLQMVGRLLCGDSAAIWLCGFAALIC